MRFRRFTNGSWWDWDGAAWVIVAGAQCETWGSPLASPSASLVAEANAQLVDNGGQPVVETWTDGVLYLFSAGPVIRPCASLGTGLFGLPVGVGATRPFDAAERFPSGDSTGLGFVAPSDVLLYRNMWNDYVLDTIRVASACATSYASLAQNEQNADAKAAESAMSVSLQKTSDDLLALWNLYANQTDDFIVANGGSIVQQYQQAVVTAGSVRQTLVGDKCPMTYIDANNNIVPAVAGPDTGLQVKVISRIEGLGILAKGILQIIVGTAEGAVHVVGSAADWADKQTSKLANVLSEPWPWIAVVAVVGGGLAFYYVPRRRAA
jgi:hypothetical protein